LFGGGLVLTNVDELWARYQYAAPVPTYAAHFTEFLVTSLVEDLAGVFGHNLNTQAVYQRRGTGPFGSLGIAIQQEQRQNPPLEKRAPNWLSIAREW
jgi:hypothetical protein